MAISDVEKYRAQYKTAVEAAERLLALTVQSKLDPEYAYQVGFNMLLVEVSNNNIPFLCNMAERLNHLLTLARADLNAMACCETCLHGNVTTVAMLDGKPIAEVVKCKIDKLGDIACNSYEWRHMKEEPK